MYSNLLVCFNIGMVSEVVFRKKKEYRNKFDTAKLIPLHCAGQLLGHENVSIPKWALFSSFCPKKIVCGFAR